MKPIKLGPTHEDKIIKSTIHLRRRIDHAPIPAYEDYIGCPYRPRLSIDEFAVKYGAHPSDIAQVIEHCRLHGLTVLTEHAARRTVQVKGTVRQHNAAWSTTIHDHQKGERQFHLATAKLPDHLAEIVVHVGLGETPKEVATTTLNIPSSTPGFNGTPTIVPSQYSTLMGWPNNGTGQTIAVIVFNLPTTYSLSDIHSTWSNWGISNATITDVAVDDDGIDINTTAFNGEWNMDIAVSYGFAVGAAIAVYWSVNIADTYAKIIHPDVGDPVCDVITESGILSDEADLYVGQPTLAAALHSLYEDAAIQSVTICQPTGDYGSGGGIGDGKDHCVSTNDPYLLSVGGTVVGNISGNQFVEWLSNVGDTSDANYFQGGGGGVSIYVPLPSYQEGFNVPASTNSGTVGRGVPDISTLFAGEFPQYASSVLGQTGGGTSQACPMTAGLVASINHSIGRNVGFITSTLYAQSGTVIRDINPGNSVGGPQSNSNGFVAAGSAFAPQGSYVPVPGYSLAYGYDACVGLGVLKGDALVTYLNGVTPPTPASTSSPTSTCSNLHSNRCVRCSCRARVRCARRSYCPARPGNNTICSFWGGNVLDACQITLVFWGTGWASHNPTPTAIETAIDAIIGAGYFDLMNEYYVFNRPSVVAAYTDASSSAAATASTPNPVYTNLAGHLNAQTIPIPIVDNHLFLYLLSDGTPSATGTNVWIDYNGTVVNVATVYTQSSGINNWTPMIIRQIVGAMTGAGGWPSGWNLFSSDTEVSAGSLYCNNTVGQSQVSGWSNASLGTSAGYSVLGYYSNIIRGTIIAGTS